jgi:hypothetical protein
MHEGRNTAATLLLVTVMLWTFFAWLAAPALEIEIPLPLAQKIASLLSLAALGGYVFYAMTTSDQLDDQLARATAGHYFERDGLCFMPLTRVVQTPDGPQAEVSLYYQSRYDGVCEAVVHIRPPQGALRVSDGASALHFAFRCDPGAFGVIHQPIGIAPEKQGTTVDAHMAAAVRWPRGHGDQLRSREGAPCGKFAVDWSRVYDRAPGDTAGEIELKKPVVVHLALPENVRGRVEHGESLNETLASL